MYGIILNEGISAVLQCTTESIIIHNGRLLVLQRTLQNSALELELRRFVLQQAQPDSRHTNHHLREFIDTRLERHLTEDDAISLAEWVAEAVPLPEGEKLQYLIRINSDRTHRYVRDILQRQPLLQTTVLEDLIRHPNPSLDLFLIEAYQAESTANVKSGRDCSRSTH